MPLLHLSCDVADTSSFVAPNTFNLVVSHSIETQVIRLKEVFIHTVGGAIGADIVTSVSGSTGKTCLITQLTNGQMNLLAERQIVSNMRGGAWLPLPCDYTTARPAVQHYTGLDQSLVLADKGVPHQVTVHFNSDNTVLGDAYPIFGTGTNNIDRVDLVFEYDAYQNPADN